MFVAKTREVAERHRAGLTSKVLLQACDVPDAALAVTWVDVQPGAAQQPHSHEPQQVYVVIKGSGRMRVGADQRDVFAGDLVFVPSGAVHGIVNTGTVTLTYVSSATPTFNVTDVYDAGPLA